MSKPLRQGPILNSGDTSTSIGCAGQHCDIAMNEDHRKNDVFRGWVSCSVLERSIHKVVGIQRIPVSPIIEIGHCKHLLIRRHSGTASTYQISEIGAEHD